MESDEVRVDPDTLADATAILTDSAAELHTAGFDEFLLGWSDAPASHPGAATAIRGFGEFAGDQYRDLVAVLTALASGVLAAREGYQQTDAAAAAALSAVPVEPGGAPR